MSPDHTSLGVDILFYHLWPVTVLDIENDRRLISGTYVPGGLTGGYIPRI